MPASAPYMPIATVGLLSLLETHGYPARAYWTAAAGDDSVLTIDTDLEFGSLAAIIRAAAWPDLTRIAWPNGSFSQGIKPTLNATGRDDWRAFRDLIQSAPPLEAGLLRALLSDAATDEGGSPLRSRLLRGVKADLSAIARRRPTPTADALAGELTRGPDFSAPGSGPGLGLVPEVQTFGGTTGPDASTVGGHSPLLFELMWRGIVALPPLAVRRGARRTVGGPLTTRASPDVLSWPRWRIPVGLRALRALFCLAAIHVERPDRNVIAERGIDAVFRSRAVPLNSMVAVFRWGEQVAG